MDTPTDQVQTQSPFPAAPAKHSGNIGPLAAAVVVVVLLAAGGFYFLYYTQQQTPATPSSQTEDISDPNSVNAIETELNATETSGAQTDVDNLNEAL